MTPTRSTLGAFLPSVLLLLGGALLPGCQTTAPAEPDPPEQGATAIEPLHAPAAPVGTPHPESAQVPEGLNDRFLSPDLDVEEFIGIFEGESREIAASVEAIIDAMGVEPGTQVLDVGAGTGLFLEPLVKHMGRRGTVHAIDISPAFVNHMRRRAAQLRIVKPKLGHEKAVPLPPESVHLAFVCDTYHHFEYPQEMLSSLYATLKPGGLLVLIDFERIPGVTREWVLDHVRAGKETFKAEIEAAGFAFLDEVEVEGLEENYMLRFVRP